jgi:FkbM family methyltransferase
MGMGGIMTRAKQGIVRRLWPELFRHVRSSLSYSAYGEDRIARGWIDLRETDPAKIRYLDIGVCDPINMSNTYAFYQAGARGVLVEPNPDCIEQIRVNRPRDTLINAGIAFDDRRSARLIRLTNYGFNTFSEEHARSIVSASQEWHPQYRQQIIDTVPVTLIPAQEIVDRYFANEELHLLSIDAEGVDLAILRSIDLRRRAPWVICIEQDQPEPVTTVLGSDYVLSARTRDNLVFVRSDIAAAKATPAGAYTA